MPFLMPKPKKGSAWLPSQVYDGIDTSHEDPANWVRFGLLHEEEQDKFTAERKAPPQPEGDPPKGKAGS